MRVEEIGSRGYLITPERRRPSKGSNICTVKLGSEEFLAYNADILTAAILVSRKESDREQFVREYSLGDPTATIIRGERAVVVVSPIVLGGRRNPFNIMA